MKATKVNYKSTGTAGIKIEFSYKIDLVEKVKTLQGRKYYSDEFQKFWATPLLLQTVKSLASWGFELCPKLQEYLKEQTTVKPIEIKGLTGILRPFQQEGVSILEQWNGRALLADDMGLGKTVQCIAYMQIHRNTLPVLIVCPNSVKLNWKIEMDKWMQPKPNIQILNGRKGETLTGDYIILNYDILPHWEKILMKHKFNLIISDECHYWKNSTAKRTKTMKKLVKKSPHIICVSGTPFENAPIEIYNALCAVNPTLFPSRWLFAQEYCDPKNNGFGWDFSGASNITKLNTILRESIMIRRLKKDVLTELPNKQYSTISIPICNRKEYEEAMDDFLLWLGKDIDKKNNRLEQNMKDEMQGLMKKYKIQGIQFSDHILNQEALEEEKRIKLERVGNAEILAKIETLKQLAVKGKLEQAIEWIEDFLESGEKLVVFCTHTFVIEELMSKFGKIAVKIDGSVRSKDRPDIIQQFQTNPKKTLFVGNIKACGEGITLTAASNAVILEFPWTPAKLNQVIDRIHRIGQTKQVTIWYLVAYDTIEDDLSRLIQLKQMFLDGVLDGKDIPQGSVLKELMKKYKLNV